MARDVAARRVAARASPPLPHTLWSLPRAFPTFSLPVPTFSIPFPTFSYLFPTFSYFFLELSRTFSFFLSDFLDFLYPPYLLQSSPTSRRRLEKVGRVEKVEKVGEEVGESSRKF